MSAARQVVLDEHDLYPIHEEDSLPERPEHEYQVWALRAMLRTRFPQHWITGDVCMYWEQRNFHQYRAPDVLVVEGVPEGEPPGVYLAWSDRPALLVVEVGSRSTFQEDEGPKVERYLLDLGVREYVYFHPRTKRLRMWRREGDEPVELSAGADGRFPSRELEVRLAVDEQGILRLYEDDGRPVPTPEEEHLRAEQALELLAQERQRAEQALQVADQEHHRAEQERERAQALELEVERLRAELRRRDTGA